MREQLLKLLGDSNLAPVQAAQATGLSEGYVSQLMQEEEFAAEVVARRSARLVKYTEHDGRIDSLEEKTLARLNEMVPFMKPMEALRAFDTFNSAKRRSAAVSNTAAPTTIVTLELPEAAHVHFKLSHGTNEVIEVAGRSLVTLPAGNVTALLREQETRKRLELIEEAKEVPGSHALAAMPVVLQRKIPIEDQI